MEPEYELNELGQPVGLPVDNWQAPPLPERHVMHGRSCRLEPMDPIRHTAELHAANLLDKEGRNWTYLPYGPFASEAEYRMWLERDCLGDDPLFFSIVDKESGQASGVASYLRITPAYGFIEVGHLNYSPRLQRTTAATEAMYLMMKHVFELGYRRYEWKCNALNAASRAAAERLGFSFEGIFRNHLVTKGRNRDTAWYSIIDSEWPRLQSVYEQWLDESNFDEEGRQRKRLSELMEA